MFNTGPDRPSIDVSGGPLAPPSTSRLDGYSLRRKPRLSAREIEVLLAWLRADSKQEAADSLYISVSTVSTHITRIRTKYDSVGRSASTKSSLFARAIQDGYAILDDW